MSKQFKVPLKVINFWAGPGAGKSTVAAGLFNLMKTLDFHVELVTEFAKDLTYEKHQSALDNQMVILAEQDRRLRRLVGSCEWAITDSPIPLGAAYVNEEYRFLEPTMWAAFERYHNYNILLMRGDRRYQSYGRNQTHEQAKELDQRISYLWASAPPPHSDFHTAIASDERAVFAAYEWMMADAELYHGADQPD